MAQEFCVSVKLTKITIWSFVISAAIHTKSVSNGPRRSRILWFHCQTDQNYNLIVLISGALHTKSVSNGARRSWLYRFSDWPKASHEICVSVKLTIITIWIFLISSVTSHEICVKMALGRSWLHLIWDDRHHTNYMSVSKWPKSQFDFFDFRCHFIRNLCYIAHKRS